MQISQQKQITSAAYNTPPSESAVPLQLTHLSGITNGMGDKSGCRNLRAQVQLFQTYTPQQIQEQLQHLHIQQPDDSESMVHTVAPGVTALLQKPKQQQQSMQAAEGQDLLVGRESSPTSSSSMLHHLLSQSPKPSSNIPSSILFNPHLSHRASLSEASQLQQSQDAVPSSDLSVMMGNVASYEFPSFPVNMQTREGSPTKGMGRRSPIHDPQMASISEDIREEPIGLSTPPFVATHSCGISAHTNDIKHNHDEGHCTVRGFPTGTTTELLHNPTEAQLLMHVHDSSGNQGSLHYPNYYSQQQCDNSIVQEPLNCPPSSLSILNRVSAVLNINGLPHYQSNGGFIVEHDDVKLRILCNSSHLLTIRMQYIAGNPIQYQTLSSHLARQLQFTD